MRIFILFSCVVAIYFGGRLTWELYRYMTLSSSAPAQIVRWDIEEDGSRFVLRALYTYPWQGNILSGSSRINDSLFLNDVTALASIREQAKQQWTVYLDAKHPERSTLDRTFPWSRAIRFGISMLVCGYFFVIRTRHEQTRISKRSPAARG